jgi:hypothetical protein
MGFRVGLYAGRLVRKGVDGRRITSSLEEASIFFDEFLRVDNSDSSAVAHVC